MATVSAPLAELAHNTTTTLQYTLQLYRKMSLQEHWNIQDAVYTGTLESKKDNGRTDNYTYIGSTATTFKERWYNHKYDLTHDTGAGTRLSGKYWELINANPNDHTPTISWKIVNKCHPLKAGCKVCDVCTTEKTRILLQHNVPEPKPPKNTIFLNQRTELFAKC